MPINSGSLLPPRGRRDGADSYDRVMGDERMKHKFRHFVNMEFPFYIAASSARRRFSAIATVSAMAKAMLAESERKPA
ncbi:hypothetical protein EFR01_54780 [Sinorhizobium fredii]|nr:hypothetical protein EFR01_54780 [Sinorhizobium fredii]